MAREIVGRTVLGAVGRRVGEGWFWWQVGLKVLGEPGTPRRRKSGITTPTTFASSVDDAKEGIAEEHTAPEGGQSILDLLADFLLRTWSLLLTFWSLATTLMATYSAAPPTPPECVGLSKVWLSLGRELLGVDGREGLGTRLWGRILCWGLVEGMVALFGRVLDRCVP
jgi:hypothetical protein